MPFSDINFPRSTPYITLLSFQEMHNELIDVEASLKHDIIVAQRKTRAIPDELAALRVRAAPTKQAISTTIVQSTEAANSLAHAQETIQRLLTLTSRMKALCPAIAENEFATIERSTVSASAAGASCSTSLPRRSTKLKKSTARDDGSSSEESDDAYEDESDG